MSLLLVASCFAAAPSWSADSASGKIAQAKAALDLCDYGKVLKLLAGANDAPSLVLIGEAYEGAESTDGKEALNQALKLQPKNAEALLSLAYIDMRNKEFHAAEDKTREALAIQPNSAEATSRLGRCLYKEGNTDKGLKMMEEVLKKSPTNVAARLNLAKTYADEHKPERSLDLLTPLVKAQPQKVLPLLKRAAIYNDLNKDEESLADIKKALSINPHCQYALSMRAHMLEEKKKYDLALADCEDCIKQAQSMDNIRRKCLRTKVRCEEKLGKNQAAVSDLNALSKAIPKKDKMTDGTQETYIKLAANYERLKNYPEALKACDQLLQNVPGQIEARAFKARILSKMNNGQAALAEYNSLIKGDATVTEWLKGRRRRREEDGPKRSSRQRLSGCSKTRWKRYALKSAYRIDFGLYDLEV